MRLFALTGGIASGKSTVAGLLAARGAVVIDADLIAREIVQPGGPAHDAIVTRFGAGVLAADGAIDRPALASVVFSDDEARADLNAITHPLVLGEIARRVESYRGTDAVVFVDVPLLVEAGAAAGFDAVVVVTASEALRVERLMRDRGMSEADARARIASQSSDAERRSVATHVVENSGSLAQLEEAVDALWLSLVS